MSYNLLFRNNDICSIFVYCYSLLKLLFFFFLQQLSEALQCIISLVVLQVYIKARNNRIFCIGILQNKL
jgi:hypothetical protein